MDSVMKGLMGAMPLQNFWARTVPVFDADDEICFCSLKLSS